MFHFRKLKKKQKKKDYTAQIHFNSKKKEKEERKRRKKLFHIHNILSSGQLVHWTLTQLLFSEMKNFTNNILRLFGVKHRKLYSVYLS